MDEAVAARFFMVRKFANEIVLRMSQEVGNLGFDVAEVELQQPQEATFRLERDPSNCEYSLVGDWFDEKGMKKGCLLFHSDGTFFVEQDIVKQHPTKKQLFVEAVNAWGKGEEIKAEARLLATP